MERPKFSFSVDEIQTIRDEEPKYEDRRSLLIHVLKMIQDRIGWVTDEAVSATAELLDVSTCDVEGVATFYSQIFRKPVGSNVIRYCDSCVCYIMGCESIRDGLEKDLGVSSGGTTADGSFTLIPTSCLGECDRAPCVMVNKTIYGRLTSSDLTTILRRYRHGQKKDST